MMLARLNIGGRMIAPLSLFPDQPNYEHDKPNAAGDARNLASRLHQRGRFRLR